MVAGLDGDPEMLAVAREKMRKAGLDIEFSEGLFDIVFSSLLFHHLLAADKSRAMAEVHRVLKPGGMFHMCDWGRPANPVLRMAFLGVQLLDGFEVTRDNVAGWLPVFVRKAGFDDVRMAGNVSTMLGTLDLIHAKNPHRY